MERVRRSCGLINGIDVDADGDVSIMLQNLSKRHIDVLIDDHNNGQHWRFMGFYGSSYAQDRDESWNLLKSLRRNEELSWFVCGDFNEIMYGFKKNGGLPREERRMEAFCKALEDCRLMDVGYSRNWFTWERGNLPKTNIRERLDKGVANENWMSMFPEATIQHLVHSISDHCPLLTPQKKRR
ncbi:reverse transcriptase [Gossypium australe]|uniref:Reverse transcriptase n=1 Tax=Gossypium australe TaxID=47621 RepID=A0A5B6X3E9_9ROSI|nr:reverse transcriptase [Gossypium australe]